MLAIGSLSAAVPAQPIASSHGPNAADEYRAIVEMLADQDDLYNEINDTWRAQMDAEEWAVLRPESVALLDEHRALLDRLVAAARLAECRWEHDISEGLGIPLGHAGLGRIGLRLILFDALHHLDSDSELATVRFWDAIRFSEHYGADEMQFIDLVATAMLASVYNIIETDEVRPKLSLDQRTALVAHLDPIESSGFPDFQRSTAVDAMIWMEEIACFLETGETHFSEDADPIVLEYERVLFRDRKPGAVSVSALLFAAGWPKLIEHWDDPESRDEVMRDLKRGRYGPYGRVWLETVERSLAAEEKLKSQIERWRTSVLEGEPSPSVPASP